MVLRLGMGSEVATATFGSDIAKWMTLVGIGLFYTGYGLGMAQVFMKYLNWSCMN